MIKRLRGTYDILPEESQKWQYLENNLRQTAGRYGYREIRTPVIEEAELFTRSIGEATDIVEKELYSFKDRKGRNIALRPEGTASVIRAYLEAGINPDILTKLFYCGDMFRYDRPQKGRNREFRQFGVEVIGSPDPALDAEVISMAVFMLESLGLTNVEINLNSVGCTDCRGVYYNKLKEFISSSNAGLCETCKARLGRNPMRVFDCKEEKCRQVLEKAPAISSSLCHGCAQAFEEVKKYLSAIDVKFAVNPMLVRGLDYYTRTAFEITCRDFWDSSPQQNALVAGGRYDNLIAEMGGQSVPAVGWAMGMERVLLALEIMNKNPANEEETGFYIASLGEIAFTEAFKVADRLRRSGFRILSSGSTKSLKSQMREADRLKAKYTLILGGDELAKGIIMLRDMRSSTQKEIPLADLESELKMLKS